MPDITNVPGQNIQAQIVREPLSSDPLTASLSTLKLVERYLVSRGCDDEHHSVTGRTVILPAVRETIKLLEGK